MSWLIFSRLRSLLLPFILVWILWRWILYFLRNIFAMLEFRGLMYDIWREIFYIDGITALSHASRQKVFCEFTKKEAIWWETASRPNKIILYPWSKWHMYEHFHMSDNLRLDQYLLNITDSFKCDDLRNYIIVIISGAPAASCICASRRTKNWTLTFWGSLASRSRTYRKWFVISAWIVFRYAVPSTCVSCIRS